MCSLDVQSFSRNPGESSLRKHKHEGRLFECMCVINISNPPPKCLRRSRLRKYEHESRLFERICV